MPGFGAPLWLVVGALAALGPVLLHLIRRRPPERAPLPTARFLSPEPHARIRIGRRPSDLLLMALRSFFVLLIFGALADPHIGPRRSGTVHIVLLDKAVDTANAPTSSGIVPIVFDSYAVALRSLRSRVVSLRTADSIRVSMITAPRWGMWSPGTSALRRAVWPGSIDITTVATAAPASLPAAARTALVVADADRGRYVAAALAALGYSLSTTADSVDLIVSLDRLDAAAVPAATVIIANVTGASRRAAEPVFLNGAQLTAADGAVIATRSGAHVVATWADGAPAAIASLQGSSCQVTTGIDLSAGPAVVDAGFPSALEQMANACAPDQDRARDLPLDNGAMRVLAGGPDPAAPAQPLAVRALPYADPDGDASRLLLLLALLVALLETALGYRAGTVRRRAGTSAP